MPSLQELLLDESKWFAPSVLTAIAGSLGLYLRSGSPEQPFRARVQRCLHLAYGTTIGVMGFGHLLAVMIKASQGTLTASLVTMLLLGFALLLPSVWLVVHALQVVRTTSGRSLIVAHVWLGLWTLLAGPLAALAGLNLLYQFHSRTWWGRVVLGATMAAYLALLIGGIRFFLSGQTFEELQGLE